jgi:tetratricopeptide (TPR) repeat protein
MNPNFERAILLFQQSRYELAEQELRQFLASEPSDAYAHAVLALCLANREQYQEATREAEQAVHLQPDFSYAHYALASVWLKRNYDKQALAAIQEALRLDSSETSYFALLAQIHLDEARWREALEAAERGLQLDAENVTCTNLRAIALVKLGRRSEAGTTIDAALRRNPDNAVTHANQGWTLLEKGQPKEALEHFREALRLDPTNDWARRGIIEALKARHFIYALMLRYFLFMAKFSRRGQWGIIVGAYIGYQVLRTIAANNPALAPWVTPLIILYVVFALMTWIASPLFNLILRLNKFGRMVLSREQIVASNWIGLVLLAALISLAGCFVYGFNSPWIFAAFLFGLLLLPVAGTFRCPAGGMRMMMAGYTVILAALGILAIAMTIFPSHNSGSDPSSNPAGNLFFVAILGSFLSGWVVNILISQRQRR